ncbi:MAG: Coenzyme F420 hydrogenase/dehydrogenase, beta subunit C-terminal domain [Clostridia bacterium]|nr:Coenzyme F420 hydrogenase/dehydrogenase, beta subunit C-terminal domain [Clostridia bacterium]
MLFTWIPCQIAALRSFVGHDNTHLILMDVICSGVLSSQL